MRIDCPYCGERSLDEFVYQGDASLIRPDPNAPDAANAFYAYGYNAPTPQDRTRNSGITAPDATLGLSFHVTPARTRSPPSRSPKALHWPAPKTLREAHDGGLDPAKPHRQQRPH